MAGERTFPLDDVVSKDSSSNVPLAKVLCLMRLPIQTATCALGSCPEGQQNCQARLRPGQAAFSWNFPPLQLAHFTFCHLIPALEYSSNGMVKHFGQSLSQHSRNSIQMMSNSTDNHLTREDPLSSFIGNLPSCIFWWRLHLKSTPKEWRKGPTRLDSVNCFLGIRASAPTRGLSLCTITLGAWNEQPGQIFLSIGIKNKQTKA